MACPGDAFTYDHFSVEGTRILGLVVRPVNTGNPFPSMLDLAKNWNACLVKRARGSVHLSTNFHDIVYTRNSIQLRAKGVHFQTSFYEGGSDGLRDSVSDEKMFFEATVKVGINQLCRDVREYF